MQARVDCGTLTCSHAMQCNTICVKGMSGRGRWSRDTNPPPSVLLYYTLVLFFSSAVQPHSSRPPARLAPTPLPLSLIASFSRTNHPSSVWVAATRRRWVGFRDDRKKAHLGEENSALKLRLEGQRRAIHELEHQAYTLREEARVR